MRLYDNPVMPTMLRYIVIIMFPNFHHAMPRIPSAVMFFEPNQYQKQGEGGGKINGIDPPSHPCPWHLCCLHHQ